jgi:hypothetical protein
VAAGKAVELLSETCHLMAVVPAACWACPSWLASAVAGAAIIAAAIPAAAIFDAGRLRRRVKLGRSQPPIDSVVGARPPVPPQRAKATVSNPRRKAWGSQNQASTPPPPGGAVPGADPGAQLQPARGRPSGWWSFARLR